MKNFVCDTCDKVFEDEGYIKKYEHALYGPCEKPVAACPYCGKECPELYDPKPQKKNRREAPPSCPGGTCCGL